jgi:uncharacterized protein YbcI
MTGQGQVDSAGEHARNERGLMLAAIASAVVRIHKQFYGKGPTKARAHLWESILLVVLEGGLMRSEQTLRDRGRVQDVTRARLALQGSIERELRAAIESELQRQVRSFMNAVDPHNELEVVICILGPRRAEALEDREHSGGRSLGPSKTP